MRPRSVWNEVAYRMRRFDAVDRAKTCLIAAVIIMAAVAVTGSAMVFNKSPNLLNAGFYVVLTDSMDGEPTEYEISTIPVNSLIAVHKMHGDDAQDIEIGDVIGHYSSLMGGNVYHRVIAIDTVNQMFVTQGDNTHATETFSFSEANGKVVNVNHTAGEVVIFVKAHLLFIVFIMFMLAIMAEAFSYLLRNWKG